LQNYVSYKNGHVIRITMLGYLLIPSTPRPSPTPAVGLASEQTLSVRTWASSQRFSSASALSEFLLPSKIPPFLPYLDLTSFSPSVLMCTTLFWPDSYSHQPNSPKEQYQHQQAQRPNYQQLLLRVFLATPSSPFLSTKSGHSLIGLTSILTHPSHAMLMSHSNHSSSIKPSIRRKSSTHLCRGSGLYSTKFSTILFYSCL
jgi:hypothetical protein